MKTLANPADRDEIAERLRAIGPASQRRWGKMTVAEMVCHLNDTFRVCMGEKDAKDAGNWVSRNGMKWVALSVPMKWPHGVQTVAECDPRRGGAPPAEIEADLRALLELFDRFVRAPRGFEFPAHPMFGKMSDAERMRWGYLHMDHHLRQFGA